MVKKYPSIISPRLEALAIGTMNDTFVILSINACIFKFCFSLFLLCCPLLTYLKRYGHISIPALGFPVVPHVSLGGLLTPK